MAQQTEGFVQNLFFANDAQDWKKLLYSWDLSEFVSAFKTNGWTDVADWRLMTKSDFDTIGFKQGHMVRFQRKVSELGIGVSKNNKNDDQKGSYEWTKYVQPGMFYKIRNCDKVYIDNWGNPKQGTEIKLASRDNQPSDKNYSNQLWKFVPTIYSDYVKIQNYNFNVFIDNWGSAKQGQVLRLGEYDNPPTAANYTNQLWKIIPSAKDGYYKLQNLGQFMDNWGQPKQGQLLRLASNDNKPSAGNYKNQLFEFIPCPFPQKHFK